MTTPLTGWWLDARIPVHVAPCGGTVTRAVSDCPIRLGPMPSPSDGYAGPNSRVQLSAMEGPLDCVSRDARTEGHMPDFPRARPARLLARAAGGQVGLEESPACD